MIDEHPSALAYDLRCVGVSIRDIGKSVTWTEAVLLVGTIRNRPGTETFAAVRNHEYAMSLEARILADLIDSFRAANSKHKPKSYPRPWEGEDKTKSRPPTVSQATIRKALAERGH